MSLGTLVINGLISIYANPDPKLFIQTVASKYILGHITWLYFQRKISLRIKNIDLKKYFNQLKLRDFSC